MSDENVQQIFHWLSCSIQNGSPHGGRKYGFIQRVAQKNLSNSLFLTIKMIFSSSANSPRHSQMHWSKVYRCSFYTLVEKKDEIHTIKNTAYTVQRADGGALLNQDRVNVSCVRARHALISHLPTYFVVLT